MTTASAFWIAEYAQKAASANVFVQSGRSAGTDVVAFLHSARRALGLLVPSRNDVVLDVGCGNGMLDIVLSGVCRQVIGLERVPDLARRAQENTADCGNVEVLAVAAEDWSGPGVPIDRVLVWEAVQLMAPDAVQALIRRLATWTRPGGRVVMGCIPDVVQRDAFLKMYLGGVRASEQLTPEAKDAIIARNERAWWYRASELIAWWGAVGGRAERVSLPLAASKAYHRFDLVVTMGA